MTQKTLDGLRWESGEYLELQTDADKISSISRSPVLGCFEGSVYSTDSNDNLRQARADFSSILAVVSFSSGARCSRNSSMYSSCCLTCRYRLQMFDWV